LHKGFICPPLFLFLVAQYHIFTALSGIKYCIEGPFILSKSFRVGGFIDDLTEIHSQNEVLASETVAFLNSNNLLIFNLFRPRLEMYLTLVFTGPSVVCG
jgi:hypothetical protein